MYFTETEGVKTKYFGGFISVHENFCAGDIAVFVLVRG